jgi:hypothetical protein
MITLTPRTVTDKFPTFELSEEGERMVEEALEDVRQGRVYTANSVEEMIEALHNADPVD